MEKKNYGMYALLIIAVMVFVTVMGERIAPSVVHHKSYVRSVDELNQRITSELQQGHTEVTTYIEGMTEEQIQDINYNLDGFFGTVVSYTMVRKLRKDVFHVKFDLEVSDNYYAFQNVVNHEDISDHPEAVKLAGHVQSILSQYSNLSDEEKVVAYHDYIVKNCRYGFLPGDLQDQSYKAWGCLMEGTCVCNGYAEAMELLLLCSGIEARMVVGSTDDANHAWNIVKLNGQWYHVDVTWDDPTPDTGDTVSHVYLNVNDDVMVKSHYWNRDAYPACDSLDENYYYVNGKAFDDFNTFRDYVLNQMGSGGNIEVMVTNADQVNYDCGFVVNQGGASSVGWKTFEGGDYTVYMISYVSK